MSHIEIKIPEGNASALRHFGTALNAMANDVDGISEPLTISSDTTTEDCDRLRDAFAVNTYHEHLKDKENNKNGPLPPTTTEEEQLVYGIDHVSAQVMEFDSYAEFKEWSKGHEQRTQCTAETYDELYRKGHEDVVASVGVHEPTEQDKSERKLDMIVTFTPKGLREVDLTPPPEQTLPGVFAQDVTATIINDHLDSSGSPWDARIHSKNKSTVKDGTWRPKRAPADMNGGEWCEFVANVKAELSRAMTGEPLPPVEQVRYYWSHPENDEVGYLDNVDEFNEFILSSPLVHEIDEAEYNRLSAVITPPPAIEQEQVITPPNEPSYVAPPADITPPPAIEEEQVITPPSDIKFPDLMKLITSNRQLDALPKLNVILRKNGVEKLGILNATRPDLIPSIYAELKLQLGV